MLSLHPDDQTLKAYGLGKLDDGLASTVDDHLETCGDCRAKLSGLTSDSFLGRFRDARQPTARSILGGSLVDGTASFLQARATVAPPSTDTLPPGLANHPDYEIKRELGRGGMGVVYLANNTMMGRDEVLKVMGRQIMERPGVLERFQREIRAVAKLRHPNIVAAYHAFRIEGGLVFSMEYVEGLDLARLVTAKGPLSVAHATYFIHQAALGLQHAHEKGLIHRDIKPQNLMLTHDGKARLIKVLDFGLAKATREEKVDGGLTSEGQALGTPDYIAPEQITNAPDVDIRADLYSLGGTLFYLLTGRPPFVCNSLYDVYQAHMSRDVEPLNLIRPEVPAELAALVAKMMAKDPSRRFQTPADVAQVLSPFFKKSSVTKNGGGGGSASLSSTQSHPGTTKSISATFDANLVARQVEELTGVSALIPIPRGAAERGVNAEQPSSQPASTKATSHRGFRTLIAAALAGVFVILGVVIVLKWERDKVSVTIATTNEPTLEKPEKPGKPPEEGPPSVVRNESKVVTSTAAHPASRNAAALPASPPLIELPVETPDEGSTPADGPKPNLSPVNRVNPSGTKDAPSVEAGKSEGQPANGKTSAEAPHAEPTPGKQQDPPAAASSRPKDPKPADFVNTIGMEFVKIPAGEFWMGSPESDLLAEPIEQPQRRVSINQPFYMGKYEVTQKQYREIMDVDVFPYFIGDELPADPGGGAMGTGWLNELVHFCNILSVREGLRPFYRFGTSPEAGGDGYRLPTHAEWEYASRAGTKTSFPGGNNPRSLGDFVWYKDNSEEKLHPVGLKKPNAWGLYDTLGNAWELCHDLPENHQLSTSFPFSLKAGNESRRRRGGASNVETRRCRFAHLSTCFDCSGYSGLEGFRLVREIQPDQAKSPTASRKRTEKKAAIPVPTAKKAATPVPNPKSFTNTIGMKFSVIPRGQFIIGSPDMDRTDVDPYANTNEMPQRLVKVGRSFGLGTTEVTVSQYRQIVHEVPRGTGADDLPVADVSWKDAINFCNELSELEGLKPYYRIGKVSESGGDGYRLPTEAEWEYACRAGNTSRFSFGDKSSEAGAFAWNARNAEGKLHPVGQLKPNDWGLYDMHGNAWEWCADVYQEQPSATAANSGRLDLSLSAARTLRGGSFQEPAWVGRSAARYGTVSKGWSHPYRGFRVARDHPPE